MIANLKIPCPSLFIVAQHHVAQVENLLRDSILPHIIVATRL